MSAKLTKTKIFLVFCIVILTFSLTVPDDDDGCNNPFFDYDQQDCCLDEVNTMYCDDCICYEDCNVCAY